MISATRDSRDPAPRPTGGPLTDPLRNPRAVSGGLRTRRALILVLLTVLIPGTAQLLAGDRVLARRALRVTLTVWIGALTAVVLAVLDRQAILDLLTHPVWSLVLTAVLILLAAGWAFLFVDTLRLIRLSLLERRVRSMVAGLLAVLLLATSGSLAYGAYVLGVGRATLGAVFQAGPALDPVDGRYNFLLMGGDAGEDRTGRRPDSISVISVDASTGAVVTFSIPRNFQNAPFPPDSPLREVYPDGYNCGDECIINSLYTTVTENYAGLYPESIDPGAEAMMDAASGVLGITVQAYVLVDMNGFEELVDAMGGIKVDAGGWVPITAAEIPGTSPVRHYPPDGWIAPGVQTLDGYHALWYARSREFVTDYERISRQQCVQQAMIAQLDPATLLTRFQSIAAAGTQIVETDLPQDQLGSFVDLALKAKNQPVRRLTIGPPDFGTPADNFVTYPDFAQVHNRVQQELAAASEAASAAYRAPAGLERASLRTPAQPADSGITEEYLQELATYGDDATLGTLLENNGTCSPA